MLAAGFRAPRIGIEGARVGTHLIGNELDQRLRRFLADTQETPWISAQAELYGEAESILLAPALPHERQVLVAQQVMLGKLPRLRRQGLEDAALSCGKDGAAGHRANSDIFCLDRPIISEDSATV